MDLDEVFPHLDDAAAGATGIAEACARLGCPNAWIADDAAEHEIVAGAVDGERLAWVERRALIPDSGWEDIEYTLCMRLGAGPVREWIVDTYNPYFGCTVGYMRWWGDSVVMIYREKHATIVCRVDPDGSPQLRPIEDWWRVAADQVLFASKARGLVERVHLPDLELRGPLPLAAAAEHLASGTYAHLPPLARAPEALWQQIAARLPAVPAAIAELLIGALAYRFWDAWPAPAATYDGLDRRRWNQPGWLPFYHHHTQSPAGAQTLLAQLELVAARLPAAFDPDDALAELACRHIAARCHELAGVCRAGHLPEETSCYFWVEWSQAEFAGARALFPAGMWAVYEALRPRARELARLGERR